MCGAPLPICGAPQAVICVATGYAGPGRSSQIVDLDTASDRYAHSSDADAFLIAVQDEGNLREVKRERYLAKQKVERLSVEGRRDPFVRDVLVCDLVDAQARVVEHDARIAVIEVANKAIRDALYAQREVDLAAWRAEARVDAYQRPAGTFWATCSVPEPVDLQWVWLGNADQPYSGWTLVCQWCRRATAWHKMAARGLVDIEAHHVESMF